ncbi:hypothetical protein PG985_009752 [Apiospora marii]|uniref:uncharacterized protein n=1 Tax=Apiospora marii TaxID=335849 RepID=UPI00312FFC6D
MASSVIRLNPELSRLLRECRDESDFGTLQHLLRHANEDMSIKNLPLAGEDGFYNHFDFTFLFDGKPYSFNLTYMIKNVTRHADEIARYGVDIDNAGSLHRFRVVAEKADLCFRHANAWMAGAKSLEIAFHVATRNFARPLTAAERRGLVGLPLPPDLDLSRLEPWFGRDRPFLQAQCNGAPSAAGVASDYVRGRPSSSSQQVTDPRPSAAPEYAEGRVSVEGENRVRAITGVLKSLLTPEDVGKVLADGLVDYVRPMGSDAKTSDEIAVPGASSKGTIASYLTGTL